MDQGTARAALLCGREGAVGFERRGMRNRAVHGVMTDFQRGGRTGGFRRDREKAAFEARKLLRDTMTHEQRGAAICRVQALLGHNV